MSYKRLKISMIIILSFQGYIETADAQSKRHEVPFVVKVEGPRGQNEALKIQADLTAARDTQYCRGAKIPTPKGEWSCKGVAPQTDGCQREYQCSRIKANLSRVTETKKLIAKQRQVGAPQGDYKVFFEPESPLPDVSWPPQRIVSAPPKRPVQEIRPNEVKKIETQSVRKRQELAGQRRLPRRGEAPAPRRPLVELPEAPKTIAINPEKEKSLDEAQIEESFDDSFFDDSNFDDDAFASLEDEFSEDQSKEQKEAPSFEGQSSDDFMAAVDETDFDDLDLDGFFDEGPSAQSETTNGQETQEKSSDSSGLEWKSLTFSFVQASEEDTSQLQLDMAWTPHLKLSDSWYLRGQVGGHTYEIEGQEGAIVFLAIDLFAHLQYEISPGLRIEGGLGLQAWNVEEIGNLMGVSAGLIKSLDWGMIDRVYVQSASLASENVSVGEIRVGVGASF